MFSFPDKMKRVFRDEKLQEQFEKNGFVIVDFYNAEQVKYLEELYHKIHPPGENGFYPSTFSKDKNYRKTADTEIRNTGNGWMSENLVDYKVMCGSFIVKYPGEDSITDTHQDMTLVDESKYTGINIWCPLVDLTDENGRLFTISGSHRIIPTYRGSTVPGLYDDVQVEIMDYMQPLYLKAGEAIIFDQSIIHFSKPNLSEGIRIATNIYFTHKESEFRICYWNKNLDKQVELFEEDDSFMTDFDQFGENIFDRPKVGKSLGLVDYNFPKLTPEWLKQLYGPPPAKINPQQLFQDERLQEQFDKQGYVKVSFISQQEVEKLTALFYQLHPDTTLAGFQSSSYSSDYAYKKKCSDAINAVFEPHFETIFKNYRPFGSAYLTKQSDQNSELPAHQDWTIVDEDKFVALNIWVPLCDTNEKNGTLYVLPGSQHGIVKVIRCPTVPMFFEGNEKLMIDNLLPVNAKAGEAVILNESLVHYSPPNTSGNIRIAITSGVISENPKMHFHYKPPGITDQIEVIEMPDDFLLRFENFSETIYERPKIGKSLGMKPYVAKVYNSDELIDLLKHMKSKAGLSVEKPVRQLAQENPQSLNAPMANTTPVKKTFFNKILETLGL